MSETAAKRHSIRFDFGEATFQLLRQLKTERDAGTDSELLRDALRALKREIDNERANNGHLSGK